MARMTMIEAIQNALDISMGRDERVVVFGEDVGYFGGVFRCTAGLQKKYGRSRCFDTPISELGIVGAAIGMAAYGLRPAGASMAARPTARAPKPCSPMSPGSRWWCRRPRPTPRDC